MTSSSSCRLRGLRFQLRLRRLQWVVLSMLWHARMLDAVELLELGNAVVGMRQGERQSLRVQLLYPQHDTITEPETVLRCSVHRVYSISADDPLKPSVDGESMCRLCFEVDGQKPAIHCSRFTSYSRLRVGESREMMSPITMLSIGNHTVQCLVECGDVVTGKSKREEFWVKRDVLASQEHVMDPAQSKNSQQIPSIIVGVKTSVRRGMPLRQAIRTTWASSYSRAPEIRVVFLGCRLPFDAHLDSYASWNTLMLATELERRAYNDLLIEELGDCEDSYSGLVNKVTSFFRYVTRTYPKVSTVMVTDDDVYVDLRRLGNLVDRHTVNTSSKCFYAGQVWEDQFEQPVKPVRDQRSKYAVSEQEYPLQQFPPFAFGPHYLLSAECLRIIRENERLVPAFRGLDDITIAMWLLASSIRPQHLPQFMNLRDSLCFEDSDIISLADTSSTGMYAIHRNLINGRTFCHGIDVSAWMR